MGMIKKRHVKNSSVFIFRFERKHNLENVMRWICGMTNLGIIRVETFALWGTDKDYSSYFKYSINGEILLNALNESHPDRIVFSGLLGITPVTVNFNLRTYRVNVMVPMNHLIDEATLEKSIGL